MSTFVSRKFFQRRDLNLVEAAVCVGCGVLSLGVYKLLKNYIKWLTNPLNKLPGPKSHSFFLGVFPTIQKEPFLAPHKEWMAEAGPDVPLIHYTTVLGRSNLLVLDKDIVRQILTAPAGKNDCRFKKKLVSLQNIIGDGLVTLEGETWKRHRRIVQPAFSTALIRDAMQVTVPEKVEELIRYWKASGEREIDAFSHFAALTLDIIGPVAFSHECRGLESIRAWATSNSPDDDKQLPDLDDPFQKAMQKAFKFDLLSTALLVLDMLSWDLLRPRRRTARQFLDAETDKIVAGAKASVQGSTKAKSILSTLLEAHNTEEGTLTKEELRDEVKTFLVAGHETTSTWCYWAFFVLARDADIQEKLYENVMNHAPTSIDDKIGAEHVAEMGYLHVFLQEVLRLYPPAGLIPRYNRFKEKFGDVEVPANTRITLSPHLIHRHPKYWDDPESFRPVRWFNVSDAEADRRRFAFIPFSAGGRNCIGQNFATLETQLIVAAIVRAFKIEMAPSQKDVEHTFTTSITMKSKPLFRFVVHERLGMRIEI